MRGLTAWLLILFLLVACTTTAEPVATPSHTPPPPTPAAPSPTATQPPAATSHRQPLILTTDDRSSLLQRLTADWGTDWNRHTIDYGELQSGGPPRDGIPALDEPQFVNPAEAENWLADNEPVIAFTLDGEVRAYPLQILIWHEIVNDVVADTPILVTFCPLCNASIVFDRRLDGQVYDFGTSGLLRNSDLVMYDRPSESLWQQFTGEGIVGELAGRHLTFLPSAVISFADFRAAYPHGLILSRETGYDRPYGENPYVGYDSVDQYPFLFSGEIDGRLAAMERVVAVSLGDVDLAYPFSLLAEVGVINDRQAGQDLVIFHMGGTSSALDARMIALARDVGATGVFDPNLDGRKLTFAQRDGQIVDEETGSAWNVLGQATAGPLAGRQLTPILHADHFWFAWAAFQPDTIVYGTEN
ncbi:MAG: DUF3179 domain-containing protein [Chloroflexota bacterium]